MSSSTYQVVTIDTAAASNRQPIDGPTGSGFKNAEIDYVTVLQVPVGANVALHIGEVGQPIPLTVPIPFEMCPPETTGIFFSVLTAGAGNVVLLVSFADHSVMTGNP